jgi:tRNA(fMet)-specific endonuclease VapC
MLVAKDMKLRPFARLQLLQRFLLGVTLLPIDDEAAYRFGVLCARLLDRGQPRMSTDLFIAARALVHRFTVVAHNTRHFRNVPDLTIEDRLVT